MKKKRMLSFTTPLVRVVTVDPQARSVLDQVLSTPVELKKGYVDSDQSKMFSSKLTDGQETFSISSAWIFNIGYTEKYSKAEGINNLFR